MKIIGLTGGIASGKNYVAEIFAKNGAVIFDADKEVHKLLELDKSTIAEVRKKFPKSFVGGKINRKILGEIVFSEEASLEDDAINHNHSALRVLEKILHPRVKEKYLEFIKSARKKSEKLAVLNIPLLLETDDYKCDKIVAIITPKKIQKERFLERIKKIDPKNFVAEKKRLEKKFEQIQSKQISNSERKKLADFVILNDGKSPVAAKVKKVILQVV